MQHALFLSGNILVVTVDGPLGAMSETEIAEIASRSLSVLSHVPV